MQRLFITTTLVTTAFFSASALAQDKIDLSVLYAGKPGSDRMADFKALLDEHFETVGTTSYGTFKAGEADDYDVVIFDWPTIYPRDEEGNIKRDNFSLNMPQRPALPADWDRPSILIGAAGQTLVARSSKFDWL